MTTNITGAESGSIIVLGACLLAFTAVAAILYGWEWRCASRREREWEAHRAKREAARAATLEREFRTSERKEALRDEFGGDELAPEDIATIAAAARARAALDRGEVKRLRRRLTEN